LAIFPRVHYSFTFPIASGGDWGTTSTLVSFCGWDELPEKFVRSGKDLHIPGVFAQLRFQAMPFPMGMEDIFAKRTSGYAFWDWSSIDSRGVKLYGMVHIAVTIKGRNDGFRSILAA